jgi:integrase
LRMMINVALKKKVITQDPTEEIEYYTEDTRDRSLTPQELNALLLGCQAARNPKRMKAAILLAAEHGASLQEVMDLRWSNIDFDRHGFGTIEFARRKNGIERLQYLMPRARNALVDWSNHLEWIRKRKRIVPTTDLVFGRLDGRAVDRLDTAWATVLAAARIENLHFHDLRAVYCTNLALTGASTKVIQDLIGHRDPRSTDRYIRFQKLFELAPWQARLGLMYEYPEVFDQVMREVQEKALLQISGKMKGAAQTNGVADLATPRYNEKKLVGANGFEPSTP